MVIRVMTADDAEEVEALVKSAFLASAAKQLAPAGIHTFFKVASKEALLLRLQEDNLMLVYEQQGKLVGMAELKQGAHLAMLFVLPDWQGNGIATQLLQVLLQQVRHAELTVRASLNSVSFYQAQGFQKTGAAAELAGLRYQPMSLTMTMTSIVTAPADPSASVL